ncbi:MAG: hypothetical protein QM756_44880 [Polyangiaceae bacterium]
MKLRTLLLFTAPALLTACNSCRRERPYTPFGVTSALPNAAPPLLAPPVSASAAPNAPADATVKKAVFAPENALRWSLEGRDLDAPSGRRFEQALVGDFNLDGAREAVTWTLPEPPSNEALPGELWLFPSAGEPKKILDFPSFLPTGSDCTPVASLSQSGTRTVTLEVRVSCATRLLARAPTRALASIDPFTDAGPRFGVRAAEAAPGEVLALTLLSRDDDGDGREDYRLSTGLGLGSAAPEMFAEMLFLDRTAGVSRDGREPSKSLLELLKKDVPRSQKKKTADVALAHVDATRRLLGSLCAEGGTPRVFDWSGNPLRCGGLQDVVDRLGSLEVSAYLALGDTTEALAALSRDGWYFGAMRPNQRAQLTKDVDKRVSSVQGSKIVIGARPKLAKPPSYSPLGFEASGALLIETESGLMRLAPDAAREEPVSPESGISGWPLEVSAGEQRWLGVSYSCDRSELTLLLVGGSAEPQPSKLLAPRPGVCTGAQFRDGFRAQRGQRRPRRRGAGRRQPGRGKIRGNAARRQRPLAERRRARHPHAARLAAARQGFAPAQSRRLVGAASQRLRQRRQRRARGVRP